MTKESSSGRRAWFKRLESPGLSRRQERLLNGLLVLLVVLFTGGWAAAIAGAAAGDRGLGLGGRLTTNPLSPDAPPPAAFVLDRLVRAFADEADWRGESGAVSALITAPGDTLMLRDTLGLDSLPPGVEIELQQVDSPTVVTDPARAAREPGAWNVVLRAREEIQRLANLAVLTPISTDRLEGGRIGQYVIGSWPSNDDRSGPLGGPAYDPPSGLIRVTPENRDLQVSEHLTLGDFLTKGQEDVWPKYLVLSPLILDKIELTVQELERRGHPVEDIGIISGFRTPSYNAGGGNTSGRGSLSRHMYGDALDFYIDNDGDRRMDDLNGDGRFTEADAGVIADAADAVEKQYPQYVGGIGLYGPTGAHGGFIHIDVRGYRARW